MSPRKFVEINWITKPYWVQFQKDIKVIAGEILLGADNSLFGIEAV